VNLPEISVKRPVATSMLFLALGILGAISLYFTNVDLLPKFEPPVVNVITVWPGASAADVESEISKRLEDSLALIGGVDEIYSRSFDNLSVVTLVFKWGEDLDSRVNDVRDAVGFAKRDLPSDAEEPVIFRISSATVPVAVVSVSASENFEMLRYLAERRVADRLKQVPGVGTILVYGGLKREIRVELDGKRLEAYGIPVQRVKQLLQAENVNAPAGSLRLGESELFVRVPGKFRDATEVASLPLANVGGSIVRLGDVARVFDGYKEMEMFGYSDGRPAVILVVLKNSDANTVEVMRGIESRLEEIRRELPPFVRVRVVADTSRYIKLSLKNLTSSLFWGIFFVLVVTYAFLGTVRPSLIIGLAIPFSLIVNFLVMKLADFTVNIMTLSALALASGMVVDNAIVVTDSVEGYLSRGVKPQVAAVLGAQEVGGAIMASSLTTVAVFVPLMFISGITSILFRSLGVVMTGAILASVLVGLTLIPLALSRLPLSSGRRGLAAELGSRLLSRLEELHGSLIAWALWHKVLVVLTAAAVFVLTVAGFQLIPTDFVPDADTSELQITVSFPEGTSVERTNAFLLSLMERIKGSIPEVEHVGGFCGSTEEGYGKALGQKEGPNAASVYVKLKDIRERKRRASEIADEVRRYLAGVPGLESYEVMASSGIKSMFLGSKAISVELYGDDLEVLSRLADDLVERIKGIRGAVDVSAVKGQRRPELHVRIDREKAAHLGVPVAYAAEALRAYVFGLVPTAFNDRGEEFDVRLSMEGGRHLRPELLGDLPVPSLSGKLVKLSEISRISYEFGPSEIGRKNRRRYVSVECNVSGRALGEVAADVERAISSMGLPPDVSVGFAGQLKQQRESFGQLRWLFLVGVLLVYMVMAGQFEALAHPLIIMFSVPFALSGVVAFLLFTGVSLSVQGFLGVVMLVGVVVNNAIVLVDYTNLLRKRGMELYEAVVEASRRRLRPVLMTTLTTIFGMIPLAVNRGEGAEIWKSLAVSVIGGMTVSMLITLVLVPVLYFAYERGALSARLSGLVGRVRGGVSR